MKLNLSKVDEVLFDGEAYSLTAPGSEGELTVLSNHEPLVTTLRAGQVAVRETSQSEPRHFDIQGGVLEVHPGGATILL